MSAAALSAVRLPVNTTQGAYKRAVILLNDASLAARAPLDVGSAFMVRAALSKTSREDVMTIATDTALAAQFWTACESIAAQGSSRAAKVIAAQTLLSTESEIWRSGQQRRRPNPVRADID